MLKYSKVLPPSGTTVGAPPGPSPTVVVALLQPVEMLLPCSVTAPVSAMTLPHPSVAPVFRVSLASAIIFPSNDVPVPRVAEVPTTQYTLSFVPAFSTTTLELLAVVSVVPISMTMVSLLAPAKLRVRVPVN